MNALLKIAKVVAIVVGVLLALHILAGLALCWVPVALIVIAIKVIRR